MDIEDFDLEDLKDELLKVVDELFNRRFTRKWIINYIDNGSRKWKWIKQ